MNADNDIRPQSSDEAGEGVDEEGAVLQWTTHPMKRRPWITVGVTAFILAVSFLVLMITESRWFGFLALVVLFVSVAKFYMPTHFRLSEQGVTVKTTAQTIHKEWSMYRSFYPDKNGVLLSPFPEPSRLENFRGVYLMFENNRDDVITFIRNHINRPDDTEAGDTA